MINFKISLLSFFPLVLSLLIGITLLASCSQVVPTYNRLSVGSINTIDTRNNRVFIRGSRSNSLDVLYERSHRVEDNAMYIKFTWGAPNKSKRGLGFEFDEPLPDNIEKIFIEDDKSKIMIWEKSQGYEEFDITDYWKEELQKLTKRSP